MRWSLLAIAAAAMLAGEARADDPMPQRGSVARLLGEVGGALRKARGHALGHLILKGMTEGQVERLIGRNQSRTILEVSGPDHSFEEWHFYECGVRVHFVADRAKVFRVSSVTVRRLKDLRNAGAGDAGK